MDTNQPRTIERRVNAWRDLVDVVYGWLEADDAAAAKELRSPRTSAELAPTARRHSHR